jgi:glutamyl-tRNA reductase
VALHIVQIGLSHQTAPVEVREQLALPDAVLPGALQRLCSQNGCGPGYALEGAVLSTCNRLELYAVAACVEEGGTDLCRYLSDVSGVARAEFDAHLVVRSDREAVAHLCRVACGLDSMILGESQIQGQVAHAVELAVAHGAAGPVVNALFRSALQAGKRARTETAIGEHATSISHVAVELAAQIFDDLSTKTALLVGAGEMAELAARNLVEGRGTRRGVGQLLVVNRSAGRAAGLAKAFGGEALGWEQLSQALWRADIVITSTAAPHAILRADTVGAAMRMRRGRPLFVIDIAVPRDVEPEVAKINNVFLYDIDDLQQVVAANLAHRQRQVPHVQAIVDGEVAAFEKWFRARDVVPTIVDLRQRVDDIREAEVEWALGKLEHLSEQERGVVLALSQRLVNKILHQPTVRLKAHASGRDGYRYTDAVRDLFGIDPDPGCGEGER